MNPINNDGLEPDWLKRPTAKTNTAATTLVETVRRAKPVFLLGWATVNPVCSDTSSKQHRGKNAYSMRHACVCVCACGLSLSTPPVLCGMSAQGKNVVLTVEESEVAATKSTQINGSLAPLGSPRRA